MKYSLPFLFLLTLGLSAPAAPQNGGLRDAYGPKFQPGIAVKRNVDPSIGLDAIHRWNLIAINATGLDHTPVSPGENRVFGEQLGPGRAARAMAIIHIAIHDAINSALGNKDLFIGHQAPPRGAISADAAIAQGARDTLTAMFPSQTASFDLRLAEDLALIVNPVEKANGVALGHSVAAAILADRTNDGAQIPEPVVGVDFFPSDQPGHWRQDPISQIPLALGAHWGECRTFVLRSADQFRIPAPPAMTSAAYTTAYNEVKRLGGDGITTPTERTPEQTFIANFWAYDGTPSLCAPPRFYNQILTTIADQTHLSALDLARLLALGNVAMADAGMSSWESKFHWDFWRPIGGIRESDVGTGVTGLGDGNPNTVGDVTFVPLGAPASNLTGPNFTPPFPTYPSGHATFGGAVFEVLRRFYHTDNMTFTLISDEYNGTTIDNGGHVRPFIPRTFTSFSQAEEENGQSRIYLGIHWSFDKTQGIAQGRKVGAYVFDHALHH